MSPVPGPVSPTASLQVRLSTPLAPAQAANMQALLRTAVAANDGHGGGVLQLVRADRSVLWAGAVGQLAGADGPPMPLHAAFEVASITKTFVAALLLQQAAIGALQLDSPLARQLEDPALQILLPKAAADLRTLRQVLGHRSGLADFWSDGPAAGRDGNAFLTAFLRDSGHFWRPEETLRYAARLSPVAAPGQRYHYSDTGYLLLGLLLEETLQTSLHAALHTHLFSPLGLRHTYLSYREEPPVSLPLAHRYEGADDLHAQLRQSADWASGGLVSTAADLAVFIHALAHDGRLLPPPAVAAMRLWQPTDRPGLDYGLGLFRLDLPDDLGELWGHDGHGNSFMYYWPAGDLAIVGSLNQLDNDWLPLVVAILRRLTHDK